MLWIALNLPQLPLDTVLRLQSRPADGVPSCLAPLVVTHKKRVGWCNPAALEAGIRLGMSEANAWSMAADLLVHPRNPLEEQQALQEAALWTLHFTPHVSLSSSLQGWGLLAEVAPSLRLFDGLHNLQRRLARGIAELGLQACWATAPTAAGAWLMAQTAPLRSLEAGAAATSAPSPRRHASQGPRPEPRPELRQELRQDPQPESRQNPRQDSRPNAKPNAKPDAGPDPRTDARPHQPDIAIALSMAQASALLDALPLHVLDSAQAHLATLTGIGCSTLGQLRRLPRAGLARRFGKALLSEIDRAYGNEVQVHRWYEAPETIDLKLELPARVDSTDALLFASRRLLLQLTGWLTARHAAVAGITLWLHHEPLHRRGEGNTARSTPVTILLAAPSRDADHLGLLLRERLGHVVLVAPVIEIALVADQIATQAAPNTELFPTLASDTENIGRLVERLQSRLGPAAVCQLATSADHRPERSHVSPALLQRRAALRRPALSITVGAGTMGRPAWLLTQPLALLTRQHKPFYQSPLTLLAGPERIESGWWDDALALRDYFIAENDRHVLLWIFRLRPDVQEREADWFLHGFFA